MLKIIIFWLLFALFITGLFLINQERIRSTIRNARFPVWFSPNAHTEQAPIPYQEGPALEEQLNVSIEMRAEPQTIPQEQGWLEESESRDAPSPEVSQDSTEPESFIPEAADSESLPVSNQIASIPAPARPPPEAAPRPRSLYFIQLDPEGTILHSKVSRNLPNSDTPLNDVLQTLLNGPSQEEQAQGIMSLIPKGTRLLSIIIRLETAYINLSEEFLYTPYGSEGYTAQLQQLIWTATEFPAIKDVQLLIEGRKLDYLGDITWIGSPIGRDFF
ncbi:MAG: GerMN domain-containing protein [Treponema sp.]|nr:GerMN domain-containing protein [Treponema sp.]